MSICRCSACISNRNRYPVSSDEQLRHAQRDYAVDPNWGTWNRLNMLRVRMGLEPVPVPTLADGITVPPGFRLRGTLGEGQPAGQLRRNPNLSIQDGSARADGEPIAAAWNEIAEENVLVIGPFKGVDAYLMGPGVHILYLFRSPSGKELFKRIAMGEEMPKCARCLFRANEEEPCCQAAEAELDWFDEDTGDYIGPEEYDPDTGWEDFPECECKCQCLYLPLFQNRRAIGGPGTLDVFWKAKSTDYLVGAVQFVAEEDSSDLIITHMMVREEFQRNRINSFMIELIQDRYPGRKLYFHDLTDQGRKFMLGYGGEELK